MSVTLREIDKDNWQECIALSIKEEQQGFVRPNVYSLAQAKVFPNLIPRAIYNDAGEMVGFVMYHYIGEGDWWIVRLMIDAKHQGKGYGRAATEEVLRIMTQSAGLRSVGLTYAPGNIAAKRLYESLGFRETGDTSHGQVVARLERTEDE